FGVSEDDLHARREHAPLRNLLRFEVARTRSLFERGRPLCDLVGRDLGFELKLIWLAGMRVLEKLEAPASRCFRGGRCWGCPTRRRWSRAPPPGPRGAGGGSHDAVPPAPASFASARRRASGRLRGRLLPAPGAQEPLQLLVRIRVPAARS